MPTVLALRDRQSIRSGSNLAVESAPEQADEVFAVIVIMPTLRVHVSEDVLESPKRKAERENTSILPVDDACNVSGATVHENGHLAEVAMAENEGMR